MGTKTIIGGIAVLALCATGYQAAQVRKQEQEKQELAASLDRQARTLARGVETHLEAGRFYSAFFNLPQRIVDSDRLAHYIPERKRQAIEALAGITLWPRAQDGDVLDAHTMKAELFDFLPGFFKEIAQPRTDRERRLQEFGQLNPATPRTVFDVAALSAWFHQELGLDVLKRQFLLDADLALPLASYDVGRERWALADLDSIVPSHVDSARVIRVGSYVSRSRDGRLVIGTQRHADYALETVNLTAIQEQLGHPAIVPMRYDDARCHDMRVFYRFVPVQQDAVEEAEALPTTHGKYERITLMPLRTLAIPVRIDEARIYCMSTRKLLWSRTF